MALFDLPLSELRTYQPQVREPADFDEFWTTTLAEARAIGGEVVLGETMRLAGVEVTDVTFPGFGGHPIKAWYARPAGATEPLPCIVEVSGYGGGRGLAIEHTLWPSAGYAYLFMDTRGQGGGWGNGGDTADPIGGGPASPGFMTRGIESPEQYYFRRVFTDAVRAVDAARELEGVDATRVMFKGGSQGGGITLAVAGLVPDLVAVMPDVPFMCHFERALTLVDTMPYGEIKKYLAVHRDRDEQVLNTLSYFDGVNLAKRAKAPSLWSVALMDDICPPSTGFAAFNWYGSQSAPDVAKQMEVYPYNGHEGGQMHQTAKQINFVARVLA
ncbi:acetylxylan esterase [Demequina sp. TTPB684]|uniref:acetylxylan esterase n=1 Tax=unclassified Demequina TaxID=2620311 RepID=UPI001CF3A456|nr:MULTISPECIES: acetylxylan esterase [unclassified Demequina]MCB2412519.1 acetylxylan esterase [Demequina sp. TTPB684]UPU87358.1 acetylxylan esterase [Demequina sp. TMPB413]